MTDFKLTILKIEGLGDLSKVECLVSCNNEIVQRIQLGKATLQGVQVTNGCLKFLLVDLPSGLVISSLSFTSAVIKRPGLHWFPLYLNEESQVKEVPEEVSPPRILVDIHPMILTQVIEITESSDKNSDPSDDPSLEISLKSKNVELMIKILDLETELNDLAKKHEEQIDKIEKEATNKIEILMKQLESSRNHQAHQAKFLGDFVGENERLKQKIKELTEEIQEIKARILFYESRYEEVKLREDSILMLLEEKDKEIMKINNLLQTELPLQSSSSKSRLSKTPDSSFRQVWTSLSKYKSLEKLDFKIGEILKNLGLEGFLKLSDEFVYVMQNKKVNLTVKKDVVYVVSSGMNSLASLESFICSSCSQEVKNFLTRKKQKIAAQPVNRRSAGNELDTLPNSASSKDLDLKAKKKSPKKY